MANFMESLSQNIQRYPLFFSAFTLGPNFIFFFTTFFIIRSKTSSVGYYTMCFLHISVFTLFMIYFEFKMVLQVRGTYFFCLLAHILFLVLLFIIIVYTFFLGDSFIDFLTDYNYIDEVTAFQYYFSKKTGFGIAVIILFILQVSYII